MAAHPTRQVYIDTEARAALGAALTSLLDNYERAIQMAEANRALHAGMDARDIAWHTLVDVVCARLGVDLKDDEAKGIKWAQALIDQVTLTVTTVGQRPQ